MYTADDYAILNAYYTIAGKYGKSMNLSESVTALVESLAPHEKKVLLRSFAHDITDEKFSVDNEFLKTSYDLLNVKLLDNRLPNSENFIFQVKSFPKKSWFAIASYKIYRTSNRIDVIGITLNSSKILTIHGWLEVVLHEMIHLIDYIENPQHFLLKRRYDPHGEWFLSFGRQFIKDGFNVQKYIKEPIVFDVDDKNVQKAVDKRLFLRLDGYCPWENKANIPCVMVVSNRTLDDYVDKLQKTAKSGVMKGLESFTILKSKNPSIIRLKQHRLKTIYGILYFPSKAYPFDDTFIQKFGPFGEISKIMINKQNISVTEDKDETDYDEMNHISDEYARKIYDMINGVDDVKMIDDEEYEVSIA